MPVVLQNVTQFDNKPILQLKYKIWEMAYPIITIFTKGNKQNKKNIKPKPKHFIAVLSVT